MFWETPLLCATEPMICLANPTELVDFKGIDESEIQTVFSVVEKSIRMDPEPPNAPKHNPYIDNFEDPVVARVEGRTIPTRRVSNEKIALKAFERRPLSSLPLDIHKSKAIPKPRGVLQTVLESLFHEKEGLDEAAIFERDEEPNIAKFLPDTRSKAPVIGEAK